MGTLRSPGCKCCPAAGGGSCPGICGGISPPETLTLSDGVNSVTLTKLAGFSIWAGCAVFTATFTSGEPYIPHAGGPGVNCGGGVTTAQVPVQIRAACGTNSFTLDGIVNECSANPSTQQNTIIAGTCVAGGPVAPAGTGNVVLAGSPAWGTIPVISCSPLAASGTITFHPNANARIGRFKMIWGNSRVFSITV